MNDSTEYIDSYFNGRCTDVEKQQFEDRCVHDQAFAEEVALYIQSRRLIKEELLAAKKAAWAPNGPTTGKNTPLLRTLYLASAAAAAVIIFFSVYLFTNTQNPSQLAGNYIRTHYDRLSQTLDGTRDSLAQGITAYNNKQFSHALDLFTTLTKDHPANTDARLYDGLTYLRLKDYDQALHQFDTLANTPSLYSNPGPFLKAVTLLQRNAAGDRETAQRILQDVVRGNLDGSREAAAWLKKF